MKLLNVDANVHDDKRMHGLGVMGGLSVALPWSGGSRAMSPTSLSSCQVISINHLPWSWTSMLIMILCVYLMFCRRLECYNTGGCVLVESRPINKLCFRRIWRGWDFLSNQFLRRMWRRITKSWREGVGSEQPERDRSILRWSGKWMKIIGEGQHFWLRKCKKSDHPPVSTFHPPQGGCRLESGASDRFPGPSSLPTIGPCHLVFLFLFPFLSLCCRNWNWWRPRVTWTHWPRVHFSIQVGVVLPPFVELDIFFQPWWGSWYQP